MKTTLKNLKGSFWIAATYHTHTASSTITTLAFIKNGDSFSWWVPAFGLILSILLAGQGERNRIRAKINADPDVDRPKTFHQK